eukprot:8616811-Karenia_brevis.AAC.1
MSEHLLKFVEGVAVDMNAAQVRKQLEPTQLGCGTPDGAPLLVRMLRAWATDILGKGDRESNMIDEDAITALDLENAYGRFYRSSALKGTRTRVPALVPLAVAQWKLQGNQVWQRVGPTRRLTMTQRGGWQGSRL